MGRNQYGSKSVWRIFLCLLFLTATPLISPQAQDAIHFARDKLVIETMSGRHEFTIELAISPQQKAHGLMYRQAMPADHGMLFYYATPSLARMWMKNTYLPLDMIFIRPDGRIENIIARTIPQSETVLHATGKVRAVLELNAGSAERLNIRPGDLVIHTIFGNEPGF